jgi:class 3 adenylate cyclase
MFSDLVGSTALTARIDPKDLRVGDLIGSGASQEQAIVSETPNLAARWQSVAEPNSVMIAESTRRLVAAGLWLVYGEVHTLDLKEAKLLLDELA